MSFLDFWKKKRDDNESEEFGDFDDFDFDDLGFESKPVDNDRHPAVNFAGDLATSTWKNFKDVEVEEDIKRALPESYTDIFDAKRDITSAYKDLVHEAKKEFAPYEKDVKKVINSGAKSAKKFIPERFYEKIMELTDTSNNRFSEPDKKAQEEAAVKAEIAAIFDSQKTIADEQDEKQENRENIREQARFEQHKTELEQLDAIRRATISQAEYNDKINLKYQKKHLELQFKQTHALTSLLEETKAYRVETKDHLSRIMKNTGLPDYVKMRGSEFIMQNARNRFADGAVDTIFGNGSYLGRFIRESKEGALGWARGFINEVGSAVSMSREAVEDASEMEQSPGEMAGMVAGGALRNKVTGYIRKKLTGDGSNKIVQTGHELANKINNLGYYVGDFVNKNENSGRMVDGLIEAIGNTHRRANSTLLSASFKRNGGLEDLFEPAMFTNKVSRSITDVIPGYLSKILKEITVFRTGDMSTPELRYDFNNYSFDSGSNISKRISEKLVSKSNVESYQRNSENNLNNVIENSSDKFKDFKFSKDEYREISRLVYKDINSAKKKIDVAYFTDPETFAQFGEVRSKEIAGLFSDYLKENGVAKVNKLIRSFRTTGVTLSNVGTTINQLYQAGYGDLVRDTGYVTENDSLDVEELYDVLTGAKRKDNTITPLIDRNNRDLGGSGVISGGTPPTDPSSGGGEVTPSTSPTPGDDSGLTITETLLKGIYDKSKESVVLETSIAAKADLRGNTLTSIETILQDISKKLVPPSETVSTGNATPIRDTRDDEKVNLLTDLKSIAEAQLGMLEDLKASTLVTIDPSALARPDFLSRLVKGGFKGAWGATRGVGKAAWWGAKGYFKLGKATVTKLIPGAAGMATDAAIGVGGTLATRVNKGAYALKYKDIYVGDEKEPRLLAIRLKKGVYRNADGKKIKRLKDIKGNVYNQDGEVVLAESEIPFAYVLDYEKGNSRQELSKLISGITSSATSTALRLGGIYAKAMFIAPILMRAAYKKLKRVDHDRPTDVYIKGNSSPVLTRIGMINNKYLDVNTNEFVNKVSDITGDVIDDNGVVLTAADIEGGLYDVHGNRFGKSILKRSLKYITNRTAKAGKWMAKQYGRALKWTTTKGFELAKGAYNVAAETGIRASDFAMDIFTKGRHTAEKYGNMGRSQWKRARAAGVDGLTSLVEKGRDGFGSLMAIAAANTKDMIEILKQGSSDSASILKVLEDTYLLLNNRLPGKSKKGDRDRDGDVDNSVEDILERRAKAAERQKQKKEENKEKKEKKEEGKSGFLATLLAGLGGLFSPMIAALSGSLGGIFTSVVGGLGGTIVSGIAGVLGSIAAAAGWVGRKALSAILGTRIGGTIAKPFTSAATKLAKSSSKLTKGLSSVAKGLGKGLKFGGKTLKGGFWGTLAAMSVGGAIESFNEGKYGLGSLQTAATLYTGNKAIKAANEAIKIAKPAADAIKESSLISKSLGIFKNAGSAAVDAVKGAAANLPGAEKVAKAVKATSKAADTLKATKTAQLASKAVKAGTKVGGKLGGKALLGVSTAMDAYGLYKGIQTGNRDQQIESGGGLGGAAAGAAIGAFGGPVTALAGAAIGGVAGWLGGMGANAIRHAVKKGKLDYMEKIRYAMYGFDPDKDKDYIDRILTLELYLEEIVRDNSSDGNFDIDLSNTDLSGVAEVFEIPNDESEITQKRVMKIIQYLGNRFLPVMIMCMKLLNKIAKNKKLEYMERLSTKEQAQLVTTLRSLPRTLYKELTPPFADQLRLSMDAEKVSSYLLIKEDDLNRKFLHEGLEEKDGFIARPWFESEEEKAARQKKEKEELTKELNSNDLLADTLENVEGASRDNFSIKVSGDIGDDGFVKADGSVNVDALTALRFKTYGLKDISDISKLYNLIQLEKKINNSGLVKIEAGQLAKFDGDDDSIIDWIKQSFGGSSRQTRKWFRKRFLPVYLHFRSALEFVGMKKLPEKIKDISVNLKWAQVLLVAQNIVATSTKNSKNGVSTTLHDSKDFQKSSTSIFDVDYSPWDDYDINVDYTSVKENLFYIEDKALSENKVNEQKLKEENKRDVSEENGTLNDVAKRFENSSSKDDALSSSNSVNGILPAEKNTSGFSYGSSVYSNFNYDDDGKLVPAGSQNGNSVFPEVSDQVIAMSKAAPEPKVTKKMSVYFEEVAKQMDEAGILDPRERAVLLSNIDNETGGSKLFENLNYSAEGLAKTWPKRYKGPDGKPNALAESIARKPELIANHSYANRLHNGPPKSGDGWKYRGRGLIQLTGKSNYEAFSEWSGIDVVSDPDRVATDPEVAAKSVIWFYKYYADGKMQKHAKKGEIYSARKTANGGNIGMKETLALYDAYMAGRGKLQKYMVPGATKGSKVNSATATAVDEVFNKEAALSSKPKNQTSIYTDDEEPDTKVIDTDSGAASKVLETNTSSDTSNSDLSSNPLGGNKTADSTYAEPATSTGVDSPSPRASYTKPTTSSGPNFSTTQVASQFKQDEPSGDNGKDDTVNKVKAVGNAISEKAKKAANYCMAKAGPKSQHKCASFVRQALEKAGYPNPAVGDRNPDAFEYMKNWKGAGVPLENMGFTKVKTFRHIPKSSDFDFRVGDIMVYDANGKCPYGHIQILSDKGWCSDFDQSRFADKGIFIYRGKVARGAYNPNNLTVWRDLGKGTAVSRADAPADSGKERSNPNEAKAEAAAVAQNAISEKSPIDEVSRNSPVDIFDSRRAYADENSNAISAPDEVISTSDQSSSSSPTSVETNAINNANTETRVEDSLATDAQIADARAQRERQSVNAMVENQYQMQEQRLSQLQATMAEQVTISKQQLNVLKSILDVVHNSAREKSSAKENIPANEKSSLASANTEPEVAKGYMNMGDEKPKPTSTVSLNRTKDFA